VDLGTEVREVLHSESFLRKGTGTPGAAPINDGDSDSTTPYLDLYVTTGTKDNFLAGPGHASTTGSVDLSIPRQVNALTLVASLDGGPFQTIVLKGCPIRTTLSTGWTFPTDFSGLALVLGVNGVPVTVNFTAPDSVDIATVVAAINRDAAAVLGVGTVVAYRCDVNGVEAALGDYIGFFYGGAPSTMVYPSANIMVQDSAGGTTIDIATVFGADLDYYQTNVGHSTTGPIPDIEAQIDAVMGGDFASIVTNFLKLSSTAWGQESVVTISSSSTALTALGLTAGSYYGSPFRPRVGDSVYGDGAFLGNIVEIHSGGNQGRVKLDAEVPLATPPDWLGYTNWYIVAKNLDLADPVTEWGTSVPTPDFYVDTGDNVVIKQDFLRDITGAVVTSARVGLYIAYTALRLDVTGDAANPSLLAFDTVTELEEALSPITPDNPLAYGLYLALLNSGTVRVYGLGIPETSADAPYGTVDGWTRSLEYLESKGVWGLATMTNDLDVALLGRTHVLAMSEPEMKSERVLYCYLGRPTRGYDSVVASGTDGDTVSTNVFDTKVATLSQVLLAAGIDPLAITIADGVFVDIASDDRHWNVIGAVTAGSRLSINTAFGAGENDDGFYYDGVDDFPGVISEVFSVKVRGAVISDDKDAEIATIVARGNAFATRRVRMTQCDQVVVSVDGVEQVVPGFYVCAARAAMAAGNAPSTPFTNFPITGFQSVTGSSDIYSVSQLNQGAYGGADWVYQPVEGAPLTSRHQVTTDPTSVETQEQSITNALDYASIFIRLGLRNFIGRYNITKAFLDTLASVIKGQCDWLVEKKVFAAAEVTNLYQDETTPTRVLVEIMVRPLYPCNWIRVTLVV